VAPVLSERPLASPLARLQAADKSKVSNLDHTVAQLGELDRQVLLLLDGKRDRAALLDVLTEMVHTGALVPREDGAGADSGGTRAELGSLLDDCLARLVSAALMMR
jgi:methyltransferase-like protein